MRMRLLPLSAWPGPGLTALVSAVVVLLFQASYQTFEAVSAQREVYLRDRAAALAARLETTPPAQVRDEAGDELLALEVLARAGNPDLQPMWDGQELYRVRWQPAQYFRAYVPFHPPDGGMRIAQIDLDPSAADFLVRPARRGLMIAGVAGLSAIGLALLAAFSIRQAAEAKRRQTEVAQLARLGQMSAVLAHEVRNPLGTIKGFAQLLDERAGPADRVLLAPILSETSRLEALVNDLLAYGRPSVPVIRELTTAEVADAVRKLMPDGQVVIESNGGFTFTSDLNLLRQALLNLIRNAQEAVAGRPGGRVAVTLHGGRDGLAITVRDNGPGLSDKAKQHLFEPFHTTKATGTGLGLAITSNIVTLLGGQIALCNLPAGGTEATIRLPRGSLKEEVGVCHA